MNMNKKLYVQLITHNKCVHYGNLQICFEIMRKEDIFLQMVSRVVESEPFGIDQRTNSFSDLMHSKCASYASMIRMECFGSNIIYL